MQKLVAGILLVIGSSGIGYYYYMEIKTRLNNLKSIKEIMIMIENEIAYSKASLPNLCRSLESRFSGKFQKFFQQINKENENLVGNSFGTIWTEACDKLREEIGVKKSDSLILQQFLGNQNYNNVDMQLKSMEFRRRELEKVIDEIEKTIESSKKMYLSLGVMSGILATIILW